MHAVKWLRVLLKSIGVLYVTLPCTLIAAVGVALLRRHPRLRARVRAFSTRLWGRGLCLVLGVRRQRLGRPPKAPFLLVSNHLSWVDIPLLCGETGCTFVAKAEIRSWPLAGWVCRAAGVIFVDRGSKRDVLRVGKLIDKALREGRGVTLFAEGGTNEGRELLPFKPSLLQGAAASGAPVHHVTLSYKTPPGGPTAEEAVIWVGGESLASQAPRLMGLPWFDARLSFGDAPVVEPDRKLLASRLHAAMSERFVPTSPPAEEPGGIGAVRGPGGLPRVVFDGDCGFCTRTVQQFLGRLPGDATVEVIPWQYADLDALGLTEAETRRSVWWVDPDGRRLAGHRAAARGMEEIGGFWRVPAVFLKVPPTSWLGAAGYRLTAMVRGYLPGTTPACKLPEWPPGSSGDERPSD